MSDVPDAVRRLVEDPQCEAPGWPGSELLRTEACAVWLGPPVYPGLSVVMRVRIPDGDVEGTLTATRALLRERGRDRANWMVGSSATPAAAPRELLALGLREDIDPVLGGLVLRREPEGADTGIQVVRAERREDYHAFYRIQHEAFGEERSSSEGGEAFIDAMHEAESSCDHVATYLALLDGEPVATARATFAPAGVVLNGGSTLPSARGRGLYRALVAARWRDAVARGTPALTTLARPSSYPILRRMGFEDACDVRVLVDSF